VIGWLRHRSRALRTGNVLGGDVGNFIIAEWRDAGGSPDEKRLIAPRHVHRSDDEAWYVVEGTLMFEIGSDEVEAKAGSAVLAPAGASHTYWNPSAEAAQYVIVMTPRIHQLIKAIHAMPVRSREALGALLEAYDSTLLPDHG
jgi:mannose-6-phosphate isomerase-like protein (cupin superfamily)